MAWILLSLEHETGGAREAWVMCAPVPKPRPVVHAQPSRARRIVRTHVRNYERFVSVFYRSSLALFMFFIVMFYDVLQRNATDDVRRPRYHERAEERGVALLQVGTGIIL